MVYEDLKIFAEIAKEQGADIIEKVFTSQIVWDLRTTYKCRQCPRYGKSPHCPPYIPDYDYYKRLINCYKYGLLIGKKYKYKNDDEFKKIRKESGPRVQNILLTLEHHAFQRNYYWAISFTGGTCRICNPCPSDGKVCKVSSKGRSAMEGIGIDVIETYKRAGIKIHPFPHPVKNGELYRVGLFLLE